MVEVLQEADLTSLLLDVSELALCQLANPELSEAISGRPLGPGQLQAALSALQAALVLQDSARPLSLETCCDLMLLCIDVSQVSATGSPKNGSLLQLAFALTWHLAMLCKAPTEQTHQHSAICQQKHQSKQ